ncbi:DUF3124 domain-containing protein [Cellulophaga baltica]|uniref:DUF3124 domain-containing protein n=2 Tax=Cellulophaga baltica TaxID=76594 RepID=A0A1G7FBX7_9FLAO|nr:DUF3124 domain-containing protein [Cellulophaga baltica]AIZ40869.1 hypothetical protein M666_04390 [Cellulophaga baltica 18]SDE73397.1 Protein of unknown function [Cellulophaga baltica]
MKTLLCLCSLLCFLASCEDPQPKSVDSNLNWEERMHTTTLPDSLENGSSYLSVYSQIYSVTEHVTHDLTATVSIRNTSRKDTLYITKGEYFDSQGKLLNTYIDKTIYLNPLETLAIVIAEKDKQGGPGANFIFDWQVKPNTSEPIFEGVMISTSGSQGLSFTTQGKKID